MTSCCRRTSRLLTASSSTTTEGDPISARAMQARCCCARRRARVGTFQHGRCPAPRRPTRCEHVVDAPTDGGAPAVHLRSPLSASSGSNDSTGLWYTIWTPARPARRWERRLLTRPRTATAPAVGRIRPATSRPRVVFPQPDSPTTPTVSPFSQRKGHPVHRSQSTVHPLPSYAVVLDHPLDAQ